MFTSLRTQCGSIAELWSSRAANVNEAADTAEGSAPGAGSLRAAFASCPVCAKHARPRQYNVSAVDCVSEHIKAKARAGDALHTSLHRCLHADPATGRPKCPGCGEWFESRLALFEHLVSAADEAHAACRADASTIERNTSGGDYGRPARPGGLALRRCEDGRRARRALGRPAPPQGGQPERA